MPEKSTVARARKDKRQGKSPSTQAGEFVHEEIEHVREGKHGARSTKQAIAIGLSKARRAGVKLPPPPKRSTPAHASAEYSPRLWPTAASGVIPFARNMSRITMLTRKMAGWVLSVERSCSSGPLKQRSVML